MIDLIIVLIIVGAALYLMQFVPLDATIKRIISVIVIIAAVIYVLKHLAVFGL